MIWHMFAGMYRDVGRLRWLQEGSWLWLTELTGLYILVKESGIKKESCNSLISLSIDDVFVFLPNIGLVHATLKTSTGRNKDDTKLT